MDLVALEKTNDKSGRRPVFDVVIETPAGCRNKYTYDEQLRACSASTRFFLLDSNFLSISDLFPARLPPMATRSTF